MDIGSNKYNSFEYYHTDADDIIDDAQCGTGEALTSKSSIYTNSIES